MTKSTITPGPYHWEKARTLQHLHSESNFEGVSIPLNHPLEKPIEAVPDMIEALSSIYKQVMAGVDPGYIIAKSFDGIANTLRKAGQIE